MKTTVTLTASALVLAAFATANAQTFTPNLNNVELGLNAGYQGGLSGGVTVRAGNVAGPIGFRIGIDYAAVNNSLNDNATVGGIAIVQLQKNTDPNTKESGSSLTTSLDATYDLPSSIPAVNAYVYGGARYNMFKASLYSPAAQATSTYSTNQLGLGAGVAAGYALTGNLSLTGDLGVDYFFPSSFRTDDGKGNTDTITRSQAGYSDYDNLINQPKTVLKAKIGVAYRY